MWRSKKEKKPVILNSKDWTEEEFSVICKVFNLDPISVREIVLREKYVLEYNVDVKEPVKS